MAGKDTELLKTAEEKLVDAVAALKQLSGSGNPFLAEIALDMISAQSALLAKVQRFAALASN